MTTRKKSVITLMLVVLSHSLLSCAKKEPLEEAGTPPMTTMEMKVPEEDKVEIWSMKVSPVSHMVPGQPGTITLQLKNESAGSHPDPKNQRIDSNGAHLLIISKDTNEFQNLTPAVETSGRVQAVATFPHPGQYMLCLQFTTMANKNHSVVQPLQIGSGATGLPTRDADADKPKEVDGYQFRVFDYPTESGQMAMPTFRITKDSRPQSAIQPIDPQAHKDAGYAVVISTDGQTFLRTIPVNQASANKLFQSPIMFHTVVPKPGMYKIWAQFKMDDKIETVNFSFKVS
jgi:hypothetical protein